MAENFDTTTKKLKGLEGNTGEGVDPDGYADPGDVFPLREYVNKPSTNFAARGIKINNLWLGGGDKGIDLELEEYRGSQYPKNQVRETISGHVTEIDDTPGAERMLFKHKTGAGVEFRPDGTVVVSARNNTIQITGGDHKVIVEGNGEMVYNGSLNLRVVGDFNLDVGGDYNVTVAGDKVDDIKGGYSQNITKNHQTVIQKNRSQYISGIDTQVVFADKNEIIKGSLNLNAGGVIEYNSGDRFTLTARNEIEQTSRNINIAAENISVIGDSGTFGGEEIVYYGKTAHIPRVNSTSMHATTFHGDLTGRADEAIASDTAIYASYGGGPGGPAGWTNTNTTATDKTTVQTNNQIMRDYQYNSNKGIRNVNIDPGDVLFKKINRDTEVGGISNRRLTLPEVRSKLRDPKTQLNETFVGQMVAEGILSSNYVNAAPSKIGDIVSEGPSTRRIGTNVLGNNVGAETKRYRGSVIAKVMNVSVDPVYNPEFTGKITSNTPLARGVKLARFLGGYGDPITLLHIKEESKRLEIAKHLYMHAQAVRQIMTHTGNFDNYRLVVAEGVYRPHENEQLTENSFNHLAQTGRAIVYELRNTYGEVALKKTFELADYWKDNLQFETMVLNYDTYDPSGKLHVQIILVMPGFIPGTKYKAYFSQDIETRYNNFVQSTNELIEIIE
jgi:hypothetical protein